MPYIDSLFSLYSFVQILETHRYRHTQLDALIKLIDGSEYCYQYHY
jgi:hypothetical protein